MREIMFRVWDRKEEFMEDLAYPWVTDGKSVYELFSGKEWNGVDIMEFVGLKDNNKNAIYEGDIIKAVYDRKGFYIGEVVFDDGSFCIKLVEVPKKGNQYDVGQTPELNNFEYMEVIGNRYEGLKNKTKKKKE